MNYLFHLVVLFQIWIILAIGLNLVVGYCGILSLAQAGYFATGAYAYALLTLKAGVAFTPALCIAALLSAAVSVALALTTWRLRGDYFILASLAMQSLLYGLLLNWHDGTSPLGTLANLTNGPYGIGGIPRPSVFNHSISTPFDYLLLFAGIACVCALLAWQLQRSPWGRTLRALRDDELVARGLGKETRFAKVQAFAISAAFAGAAGALYSSYIRFIDPSIGTLDESIWMLCMVIIGGTGNFRGPAIGAVVIVALPELLRFAQLPDSQAAHLRLLLYGGLLIVLMRLRRHGLAGDYRVG